MPIFAKYYFRNQFEIMTVVNSKEFISNDEKYFELAVNGDVCIQRGAYMFQLICKSIDPMEKDIIFEPDDDFRDSISWEDFRERTNKMLQKFN